MNAIEKNNLFTSLVMTNLELTNLAHNTDRHFREQCVTSLLQDAARLSRDFPSSWKKFIREEISPTIDNTSIMDTFVALLADFEEEFIPNDTGSVEAREDQYERGDF